jgi:hypothetical protein
MRNAYRYLAMAIATGVVLQAAAIAWWAFGLAQAVDDGTVLNDDYSENAGAAMHALIGNMIIPLLAVLLIVGIVLRSVGGALRWSLIIFALVAVQVVLGGLSADTPALGLLHGTNALLLLLASIRAIYVVPRQAAPASA